jgi:hypothetical protein
MATVHTQGFSMTDILCLVLDTPGVKAYSHPITPSLALGEPLPGCSLCESVKRSTSTFHFMKEIAREEREAY